MSGSNLFSDADTIDYIAIGLQLFAWLVGLPCIVASLCYLELILVISNFSLKTHS